MQRFTWPAPSYDFLLKTLKDDECATIDYRVERYVFLWNEFGPPSSMLLVGGIPSMYALEELKRSYAYGNFMATVLLAQVFVEHSLGGAYSLSGHDAIAEQGFAKLIDKAFSDSLIDSKLSKTLHTLRLMRNPYTHFSVASGSRSFVGRLLKSEQMAPEELVLEDAQYAIRAVVDYLRHNSPDWHPSKIRWSEAE